MQATTVRIVCAESLQGEKLTYAGSSSRSSNRVLIVLVVATILIVAFWAINGGFDAIQAVESETAVVTQ